MDGIGSGLFIQQRYFEFGYRERRCVAFRQIPAQTGHNGLRRILFCVPHNVCVCDCDVEASCVFTKKKTTLPRFGRSTRRKAHKYTHDRPQNTHYTYITHTHTPIVHTMHKY